MGRRSISIKGGFVGGLGNGQAVGIDRGAVVAFLVEFVAFVLPVGGEDGSVRGGGERVEGERVDEKGIRKGLEAFENEKAKN